MTTAMRQLTLFEVDGSKPAPPDPPAVRYQQGSVSSRDGAKNIVRRDLRTVDACILEALRRAGPRGLTIEKLTEAVIELRGKPTTETTVGSRICGNEPALGQLVERAEERRMSRAGVLVGVYRLRTCQEQDQTA